MSATKATLALATILMMFVGSASAQSSVPRTLTIVGSSEVHTVPDLAVVTAGVTTEAETAAAALQQNSAAVSKVLATIRSLGIEGKDIQTSGLSLEPRYYRPEKPNATDRPRIIGYTATNEVTMRARDLAKLGNLLDRVTVAGANRIDGIEFTVSEQGPLLDEARRLAVADAKNKADLYARAAGFALGKVLTVSEETPLSPRPLTRAKAAVAVPVEAGEMTLSARVRIVWSLAD